MIENIVLEKLAYPDIKININDFIINNIEKEIKVLTIGASIFIYIGGAYSRGVYETVNTLNFNNEEINHYIDSYKRIYKIDKLININI